MRRGRAAGERKPGGAWQWATMLGPKESKPRDSPKAGIAPSTTGAKATPRTDGGCAKGACIAGMVLQQS